MVCPRLDLRCLSVALALLTLYTISSPMTAKVREVNGVDILSIVLKNHQFDEGIQIKTLGVIVNLAKDVEMCANFGKRGVIEATVTILKKYPGSEAAKADAGKVEQTLRKRRKEAAHRGEMIDNIDGPGVDYGWKKQQTAVWVLNQFVRNEKNKKRMKGLEVPKALKVAYAVALKCGVKFTIPLMLKKLIEEVEKEEEGH